MKKLSSIEVDYISGIGDATDFFDGLCAGFAAADGVAIVAIKLGATINPILGGALATATVGCAIYGGWRIWG